MKSLLKSLAVALAALLALPLALVLRGAMALSGDPDRVVAWGTQAASIWAGPLGEYARRSLCAQLLERCAPDVCLCYGTVFSRQGARVGRRVYVGVHCNLGLVELEDDVLLGSGVHILSGKRQHHFERTDQPIREQGGTYTRVRVGRGSWIGNAAVVLADVGADCVVGAGSVVIKPVPDGALVGGNPARVLGWRDGYAPPTEGEGS